MTITQLRKAHQKEKEGNTEKRREEERKEAKKEESRPPVSENFHDAVADKSYLYKLEPYVMKAADSPACP